MGVETTELAGGLPLHRVQVDGSNVVTAMVAFYAGSRCEPPDENGIAHFLEHMIFKGGEAYPTHREVNARTDELGARLNAFTSQEVIAFHIRVRSDRGLEAIDLLTDIVGRPRLEADELEHERGVVIQEIARVHDQPSSLADDLASEAAFGDSPLGRPILGTQESLRAFDRDTVALFRERTWSAARGGAFLVGDTSGLGDEAMELLARVPAAAPAPEVDPAPTDNVHAIVRERDSQQSHLVVGFHPAIDVTDPRMRAALRVYGMILGGSMGSRLVTEIREQRGWAYSVHATGDAYSDVAEVEVTAGLDSANCVPAYERVREIVAELAAEGPTRDEIARARSSTAGRRALAFENTTAAASHLADEALIHGREIDPATAIADLDAVTDDEVRAVAAALGEDHSLACVGPHTPDEFA
ncbi:MAG: M16 family metallopeptidase [Solirubrobacterales bacterium]